MILYVQHRLMFSLYLQVSTAVRFTTIPDPVTQSSGRHEETSFSQPPTTITAVLNPILGHISAAYASRVSKDLALCSRFDFNVYSYESEWSLGAEWWVRSNEPVTTEGDNIDKRVASATQGLLKAKVSTNYVSVLPSFKDTSADTARFL
jgi:mitochondrial distribution and morphology protein 10